MKPCIRHQCQGQRAHWRASNIAQGAVSRMKSLAASLLFLSICASSMEGQVLYSNGPDTGTIGAWPVNFGQSVSNSFTLEADSIVTDVVSSIWAADDRNPPQTAKWEITTEPFGGEVLASGGSILGLITYTDGRLYTRWTMEIQNMNARLPCGTYYLQVYDVITAWRTWAFWGESNGIGCTSPGCPSTAYFDPALANGYGLTRPIGSEAFEIIGTAGVPPSW